MLAGADEVLGGAGLAHRRLACHDAALGERLAAPLAERGWRTESLAVMVWPEERPPPAPGAGAGRELDGAEARALHERLTREAYATEPAVAAQLAATLAWCRPFGAPARAPAALARVWRAGELAEIDDVGVLPGARGRGLGTRVVLVALNAARATTAARWVFLRADERDWPWAWYARLGFEVVGRHWSFVLPGA